MNTTTVSGNATPRSRIILLWIIISCFIILFLYAGLTKLLDYQNFETKLSRDPFISDFAGTVAWLVPCWEIATALWLAFATDKRPGIISSLILMSGFTVFVALVLGVAKQVPCTCGGLLERMNWTQHLVFNIIMVALAIIGLLLTRIPAYQRTSSSPELSY
ncbi:MauE/DoxX family redox-associated membrane protein [Mucilaginibacter sp. Mucisp86]|uniref:MauE/DoxX family redox-associated membrane protein n=1 Tax=Mucilaginibacter sp. Mucisp86 TaxID=3243060 RepID=UPI0039B6E87B